LAGLPKQVTSRAKSLLENLEREKTGTQLTLDLSMPDPEEAEVVDQTASTVLGELQDLNISATTPLEALQKISHWQERLKS
jgi:DNA mismatch repair ATPase MutS